MSRCVSDYLSNRFYFELRLFLKFIWRLFLTVTVSLIMYPVDIMALCQYVGIFATQISIFRTQDDLNAVEAITHLKLS